MKQDLRNLSDISLLPNVHVCCNAMMNVCIFLLFVGPILMSFMMSCPDVLSVMFVLRASGIQDTFQTCSDHKVLS